MFPSDSLPDQIGAYKVIRRLTGPGSTDIYLARKEGPMGFQRLCVLKLVPTLFEEGDGGSADELAREAAICSRLNHPNIVRMFDFFEQDDKLVLVLEHIEGVTLDRLFQHLTTKRKRLGDDAVFYIGEQLASALAYAHAATDEEGNLTPVVHRNLHPENIILSRDGRVHLTGFGIGKILGQTPDTVAGVVKGSPGYMAPEQVRGEPVTIRADVYGLGLLLWSLLLGRRRPPIDGKRPGQIALLRTDLASNIAQMIDAALEPSVNKRILSCEEIREALAKVAHNDAGKTELTEYLRALLPAPRNPTPTPTVDEAEDERPTLPPKVKDRVTPVPAAVGRRGPPAKPPPNRRDPLPEPEPPAADAAAKEPEQIEEPPKSAFPPLNMAPRSREDLKSDAWKNSIPDLDVFDELFDKAKRDSTPSAPPASSITGGMPPMVPAPGALKPVPAPTFGAPPPIVTPPVAPTIRFGAPPPTPAPPVAAPLPVAAPVRFGSPPAAAPAAAPPPIAPVLPPMPVRPVPFSPNGMGASSPGAMPGFGRAPALSLMKGPRTLSTLGLTVMVSAVTATLVAGIWLFIGFRDGSPPTKGQAADASSAATSVIAAPPRTATPVETAATTSPPPPASTPAPPPAPVTIRAKTSIAVEDLPAGYGVLNVSFPADADVYLMGKLIGPANQDLKVLCGRSFLRLAETELVGRYPTWVTIGTSVYIPCRKRADMKMEPSPRRR